MPSMLAGNSPHIASGSTLPGLWTFANHLLRGLVTLGKDGLEELLSFRGEFHPVFVSVALNGGQKVVEVSVGPWPKRFGDTIDDVRDWFLIRLYARKAEAAPTFVTEIDLQPQRPLDGDLPVAESCVGKDLRLLGFLESSETCRRCVGCRRRRARSFSCRGFCAVA